MDGKTIDLGDDKLNGLLDDKTRGMVYIQSSGANINWMLKRVMNKGLNYVEDIMKAIGIKRFEELLVDGTGYTEEEKAEVIEKPLKKIDDVIEEVWK